MVGDIPWSRGFMQLSDNVRKKSDGCDKQRERLIYNRDKRSY
jgi:hypothetical protein